MEPVVRKGLLKALTFKLRWKPEMEPPWQGLQEELCAQTRPGLCEDWGGWSIANEG